MIADAIALQWIWERAQVSPEHRQLAKWGIGAFLALTLVMFVYFYPILAADPISYATLQDRLWFHHWVIGPG
jgi:dolichyl-phosphate-mannose--protein O-mannosyl transferase